MELDGILQARLLRGSMLVVTVKIEGGPSPRNGMQEPNEKLAAEQRAKIHKVTEAIWKLEGSETVSYTHLTLPTICSV